MGTTPRGLRYPEATVAPFVHLDLKTLAEDVDTRLVVVAPASEAPSPTSPGRGVWVQSDTQKVFVSLGGAWVEYGQRVCHARFVTNAQLSHGAGLWNLMPIDSKTDVMGEDVLSVSGRTVTVPPGLWHFDAAVTMSGTNFIPRIANGSTILIRGSKVTSGNEAHIAAVRRLSSTGSITLQVNHDTTLQNMAASATVPFHLSATRLAAL